MVARKKRKERQSGNCGAEARGFAVVVEDLRAQFTVFGEAQQGLREEMCRRFDEVKSDLTRVKTAVLDTSRDVKDLHRAVEELDARKVDRAELGVLRGE